MTALDAFAAQRAEHVAHDRGWTLDEATRWVESSIDEARKDYRERGAPMGDTEAGFIAWLQPRKQPLTA